MNQDQFLKRIQENWTARLRWLYEDYFEFADGKVTIFPEEVLAGTMGTWTLTLYTPFAIEPGGEIVIQLNNSLGANWAFNILQTHNPGGEGYVTVSYCGSTGMILELIRPNLILLHIEEMPLQEGEKIKVLFGDRTKGGSGARVKIYTQQIGFYVKVKASSRGRERLVRQVPTLSVLPREVDHHRTIVCSLVDPGKKVLARYLDFDRFNNPIGEKKIKKYSINEERNKDEPQYISVIDRGLCTNSNPFLFKKKNDLKLYWGEIHGHAYFSDGLESPEYFYSYARDVEQLDFCSLTEHDSWLDNRKWEVISKTNEDFYEPGRFITFLGFEWSSAQFYSPEGHMYGHKCVYYPGNEGRYYSHLDPRFNTPVQLWEEIFKFGGITAPHHPAYGESRNSVWGTNWQYHDDLVEPLVEIYSKHGLNEFFGNRWPLFSQDPERFVQKALARGYKLGFTAGTDTHISRPGSNMPEFRRGIRYAKGGLTAVYARELNRNSIFNALKNRCCYATTGERIVVVFKINGYSMGSIIKWADLNSDQTIAIEAFVAGTDRLEKIEIIKCNKTVYQTSTDDMFLRVEWEDKEVARDSELFYYFRITQTDSNMAWSSPIWIVR